LILSAEEQAGFLLQVYARSAVGGALTEQERRQGALRLPTGMRAAKAIEVTIGAKVPEALTKADDELIYLRVYETSQSLDQPEQREQWKSIVPWTKRTALPEKKERRTRWFLFAAVLTITAGVTVAVLISGALPRRGMSGLSHSILVNKELGLQSEGKGGSLLLGWNRLHPMVRSATGGMLRIDDGLQHREVHLDPEQVASGSILYMPATDDVTFQLELYGKRGEVMKESMRVLDGQKRLPVEVGASKLEDTTGRPIAARSLPLDVRDKKTASESKQASTAAIDRRSDPVRTHPEPEHTSRSAAETSLSDGAKPVSVPGSVSPVALVASKEPLSPNVGDGAKPPPEPPEILPANVSQDFMPQSEVDSKVASWSDAEPKPAPPPDPVAAKINSAQTRPSTQPPGNIAAAVYVPPQSLRQVMPNQIPRIITSALTIEVEVKLDRNGHVESARLAKQAANVPLYLGGAVLSAAKQWTFKPATLGGIRVESDYTIVFRIRPTVP
jgi:TonB family protein